MIAITLSTLQAGLVILLALLGFVLGRWFSRRPGRYWLVGYFLPLAVVGLVAIPRWVSRFEIVPPFDWIMSGRTEAVLMAVVASTLLSTPLSRLPQPRQRHSVIVFTCFFVGYISVLPFLLPALQQPYFLTLKTTIDRSGVCRQSNNYNCGPASAVTALRNMGVMAEEGVLAIEAKTNFISGTDPDLLSTGIKRAYGVECQRAFFNEPLELKGKEPCIALIKYALMVDHYVTVLSVTDKEIVVGDPLTGRRVFSHIEFEKIWRKNAILLHRI
ncbi:MAG: hypothetical protein H6616_18305 [Ignavibacteria bacterium]|nr:hypothetical protein [Ignavibacteria bacterium]